MPLGLQASPLGHWLLLAPLARRCTLSSPRARLAGNVHQRARTARLHGRAKATTEPSTNVNTPAPGQQHTEPPGASRANAARPAPTFQEAIFQLQQYWSKQGCVVWQPHNTEVGAGTMNPATFLRVLGPEPWSVCYVEPSVRPDDSRYGENPNRVQQHTQFQVILKPDPGNPQELYLASLASLGIDTRLHDIRFVEDNWESPALGAWGLGWEVWLDGMEVTQFTYFQQCGSQPLPVPAVEITYGLERILMALQGAAHVKDIRYTRDVSYGELFMQSEYEMSVYNLDQASVPDLRQLFARYEEEAKSMLEQGLPIPAYNQVLKLSHTFNVLDARGAVGFTERQDNFTRMRGLAKRIAEAYMQKRTDLEHPLGVVEEEERLAPRLPGTSTPPAAGASAQDLLIEVGVEELPPADLTSALEQLRRSVPAALASGRLAHGTVTVQGTPRRLTVSVSDLAPTQTILTEEKRGPPRSRAFDDEGKPTKALLGFCKSNKVEPAAVYFKELKGTEYCFATVEDPARSAAEVLAQEISVLLKGISFGRTMRWRPHDDLAFPRPLRWLVALLGDDVVDCTLGTLRAGRTTRLLRTATPPTAELRSAADYDAALRGQGIVVGEEDRRHLIWKAVQDAAQAEGGMVPESAETDLLPEVSNLVEAPKVLVGHFDQVFLELPTPVLVTVMRKHQRYFPVYTPDGSTLLSSFVFVANGDVDAATVCRGNEAVLRARFSDARFFYNEDLRHRLEDRVPLLAGTAFQRDLGSMLDKVERVVQLVPRVAHALNLGDAEQDAVAAAKLCRADLATATVTEMTSLAGVIGKHLAEKEQKPEAVATAIFESVLPRTATDELPATPAGIIVSCADKLDSLIGLATASCLPSGSTDHFSMRRTMYGLLQTLVQNGLRVDVKELVQVAGTLQPLKVQAADVDAVVEFSSRRLEQLLLDEGVAAETVRAVLSQRANDPTWAVLSARDLSAELEAGAGSKLPQVLQALSRPTRIVRGQKLTEGDVDQGLFESNFERDLWEAYETLASRIDPGSQSIPQWIEVVSDIVPQIDAFFDNVFVMTEDEKVKENRLRLLHRVASLPTGFMDLSQLPGF